VHDPVPLRNQFGFGLLATALARHFHDANVSVLSLTDDATMQLRRLFPGLNLVELLHPILSEEKPTAKADGTVLVIGQFKPFLDLDLLVDLGPLLRQRGLQPQIVDRGWPTDIPSWEVTSVFVPDEELVARIVTANVMLIPDKWIFQSGIMIRGLELGTPSVAQDTSLSRQVLGKDSPLVIPRDAIAAVWAEALEMGARGYLNMQNLFADYQTHCDAAWQQYLSTME
jgi:hypothetical protein